MQEKESILVTRYRLKILSLGITEPPHDKTNKMTVRPAKTQISLGIRPVWSVFAVSMKKPWALSYPLSAQRRLWSDWAHTHFVGFVMLWLNCLALLGKPLDAEQLPTWRNSQQLNDLQHDETNKLTCAPSKDSDHPGHPSSLISLRCPHEETLGP